MKTLKTHSAILLLSILSIIMLSCSSDDDGGGTSGDADFITAKVAGNNWSTDSNYGDLVVAQISNDVLLVQGSNNAGEAITIQLYNYTGTGTYRIGTSATDGSMLMHYKANTNTAWINNFITQLGGGVPKGEVIVTEDDGVIVKGTFKFEGYNEEASPNVLSITDGNFRAHID